MQTPDSHTRRHRIAGRPAFTLIELLVVVSIIALLIAILVPALGAARTQAKNTQTSAIIKAISTGCEMFKNENEKEFRLSNGYPPSKGYNPALFPGVANAEWRRDINDPDGVPMYDLYGAHWLARMLLGADSRGFVRFRDVPEVLKSKPETWYLDMPGDGYTTPLTRVGPYIDPESVTLVKSNIDETANEQGPALVGVPDETTIPPTNDAKVIVDPFGRPFLYYAANPMAVVNHGRIAVAQDPPDMDPSEGPPLGIYDFRDNEGFTGNDGDIGGTRTNGFLFNAQRKPHLINSLGNARMPHESPNSFIGYIHNHSLEGDDEQNPIVVPYNPNTFLLLTPGKDGIYGNQDDINNFERQ